MPINLDFDPLAFVRDHVAPALQRGAEDVVAHHLGPLMRAVELHVVHETRARVVVPVVKDPELTGLVALRVYWKDGGPKVDVVAVDARRAMVPEGAPSLLTLGKG